MADSNDTSGNRAETTTGTINRRRFLGYTGTAGVGGLGLTTASVGATFVGDTREIVFTRDRHGPATTKEVPDAWYEQAMRSHKVQDALKERYEGQPWLGSVNRRAGSEEIGGLRTFDVSVGAKDVEAARRALPDQIDGFAINVHEYAEPTPTASYCNVNNYSCVYGGAYVVVAQNDGDRKAHSGAGIAQDPWGNVHYLTCAHGFRDSCTDDIRYNSLWQGSDRNYVGFVENWDATQDWALIKESSNSQVAGIHNKVLGASPILRGWVSRSGVDYLISNDYTTYKYGAATCRNWGPATGDRWSWYCGDSTKRVEYYLATDHGDSGAPHYIYNDGYIWLIGQSWGFADEKTDTLSQAAFRINDDHGITFGNTGNTC